jgi:RimJ/RimL family protein N-acetyltransferase
MIPAPLATPRLRLERLRETDVDAVFEACQDPELQRFVPVPSPYERSAAEYFVGAYGREAESSDEFTVWGIRDAATDELVGAAELRFEPVAAASLGFWLAPPHRGRGLMTEAARRVTAHGLDDLGLRRIGWEARAGNIASALVAQRAGYRFEGETRLGSVFRGERVDGWHAAILDTDERTSVPWPVLR